MHQYMCDVSSGVHNKHVRDTVGGNGADNEVRLKLCFSLLSSSLYC